jgi:hypothetical protein
LEERIGAWFRERFGERIRLRRGEVCDALVAFGVTREPDRDLKKFVDAGLMSVMPPVHGEIRKSYHRDAVLRFVLAQCRE